MSQAENLHTTPACAAPTAHEEFDQALVQAQTITLIISFLADVNGVGNTPLSAFGWLAEELNARLERIEVADMAMERRA